MWDRPSLEGAFYKELEASLLAEFTGARPGMKILDVCCGAGRNTLALANTSAEMWGIDGAPEMIEQATSAAASSGLNNATFSVQDARTLSFENETFDAVVGTRFMYMMSPAEKTQIISEARRVLKPGGIVVFQFNSGFWGVKHEFLNLVHGKKPRLRNRYLWPGGVSRLFPGFRVDKVVGIKLPRLGLISRITGKPAAFTLNRMMRWPGFRHLTSYVLVQATKCQDEPR
jgi:SAM-dependent methyltransferase